MLRTKVMLALGGLLIILLAMGLYSMDRCSDLGKQIETIDRNNDRAGRNIEQMKLSCGVMTSALLLRVTGDNQESMTRFGQGWGGFRKSLEGEQASTDSKERKLADQIASKFQPFQQRAQLFLQGDGRSSADPAIAKDLGVEITSLFTLIEELEVAHVKGANSSGKTAAASINETVRFLALLMLIACVVAIAASLGLSRGLLNPLATMASSIQQVGEGNLDQTLPVLANDELGMLARSFNRMSAQLKEYRANTSEELLRLNMTIRATLASFPDPIFVLNSEGVVEFRNPEGDQLAIKLLFAGVTRLPKKVDEKVEQVRGTGEDFLPTRFEEAIKFHLDGQDRYFLPRIVTLRDEKKESFGVAVILEDVTRMLLLDDVKSNLISTVSHELKTPLTSVRMALYLLVEKTVGPLNEKQHDLVLTAREDADRLLRTLNDLLDLAKLEQGPALLDLRPVSPAKLVETAVYSARETAHAANIEVSQEVKPGLPEIQLDQQRVAYVFNNLVTNALKYSPEGTKIHVGSGMGRTRAGEEGVRFCVKDEGPGISPDHQEHIFERFYRIPGTNRSGAGLGLSIAREIVVAHGGEIGVLSTLGEGSEFFFVLPIQTRRPAGRNDLIKT